MTERAPERPDADPRSTPALLVAATREAGAQLSDLLRLARLEARGNLRALATFLLPFAGALLLVLVALVLLLIALRDVVAVLVGSDALAGLIVALPFVAATALLLRLGFRRMHLRPAPASQRHCALDDRRPVCTDGR